MVWLMGAALFLNLATIIGLVVLIGLHGMRTFWPGPVDLVTLTTGEQFLGIPVSQEPFDVPFDARGALKASVRAGELPPGVLAKDGRPLRRLYRVGNRDLGQQPFRWVELADISSTERPRDAAVVERVEWGIFLGIPRALAVQTLDQAPLDAAGNPVLSLPAEELTDTGDGVARRTTRGLAVRAGPDGKPAPVVVTRRFIAEKPEAAWTAIESFLPDAIHRRDLIRRLQRHKIGPINAEQTWWRERIAQERLDLRRAESGGEPEGLSWPAWSALLALAVIFALVAVVSRRRPPATRPGDAPAARRLLFRAAALLAIALAAAVWLERPGRVEATPERLARLEAQAAEARTSIDSDYAEVTSQIAAAAEADSQLRLYVDAPGTGRFAPERQTTPDEPMRLSQVVRIIRPNTLSFAGKVGVYLDRWREFLLDDPREANTEGGVFPVIFGTVLLTMLLSIIVVPLGVLAALYLREYARQGLLTSIIRIAVNNLAGVPSIVYGVFGLGFFCYAVGGYVDAGPGAEVAMPLFRWWFVVAGAVLILLLAMILGTLGLRKAGRADTRRARSARWLGGAFWCAALALIAVLLATSPYFHGFFEAKLPDPTFGKRGLLWASLTLALLTLPVVIVSTEEAIAAVQPSLREGSYGCGASKWQTIKRIVLPSATPGILTGMILAMARGAGEVAPLMLVGALKWAPELPISTEPPFLHLDRSFMHLGFHIYDLGFQSPDSEAARPLVWTSTLLLIAVILILNLAAVALRARVRRRVGTGHF